MNFYDRLFYLCSESGTNITNVCKRLNLSTGTQSRWKSGSLPSADVLVKLSTFFNVSIEYLLTGKEHESPKQAAEVNPNEIELLNLFRQLSERDQIKWIVRTEDYVEKCNSAVVPSWAIKE